MDTKALIKTIEEDTIAAIKEQLSEGKMTDQRAKEIASYIITKLQPSMSIEEIYNTVMQFDTHFPELRKVVLDVSEAYDEEIKSQALSHVHALLQKSDISDAHTEVEKAISEEKHIADSIPDAVSSTPVAIETKKIK